MLYLEIRFSFPQGNIQRSQLVVEQLGDSRKSMVKVSILFPNIPTLAACTVKCELLQPILYVFCIERFSNDRRNQSNFSDQSQQEQTVRWTNQNSSQLPVIRSMRGKNRTYKVRLFLVFASHWLENWREFFLVTIWLLSTHLIPNFRVTLD